MLPYTTIPSWSIGPLHMNMYGVMFALGTLTAWLLAEQEAKRRGIDAAVMERLFLWIIIGMLVGARAFYVLFYWPQGVPLTALGAIAVWKGGLAFFGGLLGALIAGYIFTRRERFRFLEMADIFVIPLVIGHAIGRVGDHLTGAHPGSVTTLPWGIQLHGAVRHPVVLYEILGLLIILGFLLLLKRRALFPGILFASYIIMYALQRMLLDMFRIASTDPRTFGLTPTQIGLALLAAAAAGFIWWRSSMATPAKGSKRHQTKAL